MIIEIWNKLASTGDKFTKTDVKGHVEIHRPFQGYDHNPKEEEDLTAVCVVDDKDNYFPIIIKLTDFEARMLAGEILKGKRKGKGKLNAKVMGQHVAIVNINENVKQ